MTLTAVFLVLQYFKRYRNGVKTANKQPFGYWQKYRLNEVTNYLFMFTVCAQPGIAQAVL